MSSDVQMNSDALTLEETNRVRVSLGLKPIGEAVAEGEDAPVDTDLLAEENYAQRRLEMAAAKKEQDLKEKIEKSALNSKLKGSTLGANVTDDSLSAKSWIKKQKKRAQENERSMAQRRARDMEEQDSAVYDERDIAGLKVNHAADDFETGEDVVLTLKDSGVLAGEEDELQNVNLIEDEALKAAKERKRKAQAAYTGYDDEEFDEDRIGRKADILGKYDDEFSTGKMRSEGFRLGAAPKKEEIVVDDTEMIGSAPMSKVKLNLDYAKDFEVGDYAREGEAGFKKLKKKKPKRNTRRAEVDEEEGVGNGMEVDAEPRIGKRQAEDGPQNLVDDDDLQAALARSRRENARKKPKVKAEDIIAQIASTRQEEEPAAAEENGDEDGRITFDDTSEFVRNVTLDALAKPVKRERAASAQPSAEASSSSARAAEPTVVKVKIERPEDGELGDEDEVISEDEDEDLAEMAAREGLSLAEYRLKIDREMQEMQGLQAEDAEAPADTAPVTGSGMSGYLNLLRQSGALQKRSVEDAEREAQQVKYDLWIADHRARMAKREIERLQARNKNVDQAQKEWENKMREKKEAEEAKRAYESYRPDIKIEYTDEFGRVMTPKEAWKSLSHKFHGKTSGRMKTEKRLKKIAEERKQVQMQASDTPTGMTDAFSRRQQKTGEAHMVLSVGNKGSVQAPSAAKKKR